MAGAQAIKFANLAATADGDNTVVAGVAGKRIQVLGYAFTASGAGTILFQDTANVALASVALAANGGVSYAGGRDCPAFETPVGTGLEVNVGAGIDATGHLCYIEV